MISIPLVLPLLMVLGASQDDELTPFVELPPIFTDGMVLQRETTVPVWGAALPGAEVRVGASWLASDVIGRSGENGRWNVEIATPTAGGPHALVVSAGPDAEFIVRDVWIGEVWLASGQSNMEWTLGPGVGPGTDAWRDEVAGAELPLVRAFYVHKQTAWVPREVARVDGWTSITPDSAGSRSAVAYYFARNLWNELRVPVGIIESSWGGSRVEAWMSSEVLAGEPDLVDELERMAQGAEDPEGEARRDGERRTSWWRSLEEIDPGRRERWTSSAIERREWREVTLPATYSDHGEGGFDGVIWYRRSFELNADWTGREVTLCLGAIDDRDTTWINGVRVGGLEDGGSWATARRYELQAGLLRPGNNTLAIRALDTGGVGGLTGQADDLYLEREDGERTSLAGRALWRRGASSFDLPPLPPASWMNKDRPAALYQAMIAPWVGYGVAGFLWYQGESNRLEPVPYAERFPRMIQDWRARWGRGELPFYFVQIAPHGYGGDKGEASELREAQAAALALPATGMAVTTDVGDPDDIHPSNKRTVGERLARLALANQYGREELDTQPPQLVGWQIDGAELRLVFDEAIRFEGEAPGPFYLAGDDQRFLPAEVLVQDGDLVLSSALVPKPVAARFAWRADDPGNLSDTSGLPAAPFRTDTWPSVTRGGPEFDPR